MITEENFIDFKCPYCREAISFPEADIGFARACPICTETVIVPPAGSETGTALPIPITTPRLTLRRFIASDWKDLLEFVSGDEVFRFVSEGPLDEDQVLRWLEVDRQVRLTTPDQIFYLGIQLQEGEKLVGYAGLRLTDPLQALIHIVVNPAYQRKGIAKEALEALLGFCFKGIRLHRVTARCDSRNNAALKLLERAGMRREGEFIKDTPSTEGWLSTVCFAKLQEEFQ